MINIEIPKDIYEAVKQEYLSQLTIPKIPSQQQFFLCPVGYTASGKSTVLNKLESHFSWVRLSTDELRRLFRLRGFGQPGSSESLALYDELVDEFINQGHNIAFDSNCGNAKELIGAKAKKVNAKIFWIHINPPEEYIINKLTNYKHTWLYRDAEHAISRYRYHKERMSKVDFPFIYTFDPSKENLAEQADECAKLIKQELT